MIETEIRPHRDLAFVDGAVRVAMGGWSHRSTAAGRDVWFLPSVFPWPWVAVDVRDGAAVVSYCARGAARIWQEPGRRTRRGSPSSSDALEPPSWSAWTSRSPAPPWRGRSGSRSAR